MTQIGLRAVGDLVRQIRQSDSFPSQLPLVPMVIGIDVALVEMNIRLDSTFSFQNRPRFVATGVFTRIGELMR